MHWIEIHRIMEQRNHVMYMEIYSPGNYPRFYFSNKPALFIMNKISEKIAKPSLKCICLHVNAYILVNMEVITQ